MYIYIYIYNIYIYIYIYIYILTSKTISVVEQNTLTKYVEMIYLYRY